MSDLMIKIENLKKQYKLGTIGGQTLNAELQSWWARKRGKEDPNLKIGQDYSNAGEKFWALNGINLEVKKGEALGIIGHNGAGKSTLLKILSRVTAPTEGDIWLNGRVASMLEVGTGFHGELTGRENIYMNGAILGMTKKEVDNKLESIIDFSECRQFIDTPVKRYSSGMYVKLAFAVASHLDAEIMVMDEVLAVGDMKFQKKCLAKMGDASVNEGRTVLYVSHNMATIRNLCTRCVVLSKGEIVFDGDVEKAITTYMNFSAKPKLTVLQKEDLMWSDKQVNLGINGSILRVEIMDKEIPLFAPREKMILKVTYTTKRKFELLCMGIQLYADDLTTIGFGTVRLNESNSDSTYDATIEFDLLDLAEGSYCFRLNLHLLDRLNQYSESIDQTNYIYFDVSEIPGKLIWHKEWWSNLRLDNIKVLKQERID